jgi:hypothetical protein
MKKEHSTEVETKSQDIIFRINRNTILTLAIVTALLVLSYSFGKAQNNSNNLPSPAIKAIPLTTPSPTSSPKTVKPALKVQNSPQPTKTLERKKVSISLTDSAYGGTYYCFEDNVNLLSQKDNEIRTSIKSFDLCVQTENFNESVCKSSGKTDCINAWWDKCAPLSQQTEKARAELASLIKTHCP